MMQFHKKVIESVAQCLCQNFLLLRIFIAVNEVQIYYILVVKSHDCQPLVLDSISRACLGFAGLLHFKVDARHLSLSCITNPWIWS